MSNDERSPLEPECTPVNQLQEDRYSGFYETGNIRPLKNRSGIVAAVLLACIFCGSLLGSLLATANSSPRQATSDGDMAPVKGRVEYLPVETEDTKSTEPSFASHSGSTTLLISDTPDAVPNVQQEGGLSLQEIYKKVNPSVVEVTASVSSGTAYGSGVIMSHLGYVITNASVISGAYSVRVTLSNGRTYEAQVVGRDEYSDLAVLYIDAKGLTEAEFGNSDLMQAGDAIVLMGDMAGDTLQGGSMTDGIIASIHEDVNYLGTETSLLQTTAALAKGCTGGPVVNCYGQVVGITSSRISNYCTDQGVGIAIPVNTAKDVVDQLISLGYVRGRVDLGLETTVLDYQYRVFYGLPEGLFVTAVQNGSSAEAAGLQIGDVILYAANVQVRSQEDLLGAVSSFAPGDQITMTIYRISTNEQFTSVFTVQETG